MRLEDLIAEGALLTEEIFKAEKRLREIKTELLKADLEAGTYEGKNGTSLVVTERVITEIDAQKLAKKLTQKQFIASVKPVLEKVRQYLSLEEIDKIATKTLSKAFSFRRG